MWRLTLFRSALRRLKEEDCEFKVSLGYIDILNIKLIRPEKGESRFRSCLAYVRPQILFPELKKGRINWA